MLTITSIRIKFKFYLLFNKIKKNIFSPKGDRTLVSNGENIMSLPLDYEAFRSPVQVSHLFQLVTKQLHYFYANQAKEAVYLNKLKFK